MKYHTFAGTIFSCFCRVKQIRNAKGGLGLAWRVAGESQAEFGHQLLLGNRSVLFDLVFRFLDFAQVFCHD